MGTKYTRNDTSNNIADGNIINATDLDGEFDAVQAAFATSGHTHDGTVGEGGPVTVVGPAQDLVVSATNVNPKTTNTLDLGTSSLLYKDAYLTGTITAATLDISGNVDIDGTLETDALTINGSALVLTANDFTDADHSKLDGIEASATADQSNDEIKAAVEAASDSNTFTDADHTKLNAIEASADVTDTTNVTAAGALMDSEVTNLAQVKAFDASDYATAAQGTTADAALPKAGGAMTGAITTNSTFDGRDVATDGAKLDGIEASATADQSNAEIRTAVEAATDSNVFTDADHTKLNAIEASATADQTDAEIRTAVEAASDSNVFTDADHTKLNAIEASADVTDSTNVVAALTAGTGITIAADGTIAAGPVALTTVQTASSQSAQLALTAQEGDVVVRSDENKSYMHNGGTAGTMDDYTLLATPTDAVLSVNGVTGAITAAHIATAVEAATDSNVFTDADHTKLNGIEASADVTDATNVTAAGALMDSEITNLAQVKAFATSDYATAAQGTTADAALPKSGGAMTGAITTNSTFDGRDVATDGAKLDGIEASATADQSAAEIKTLLEDGIDSVHYVDGSIDTAHIGDDQVTADKLADSINSAIAANTAKETNVVQTTVSGSSGSCTGNAATATTLATARTIAGVSFNGSANISLNNNAITNGAGYTTNVGDITGVTAGTGLTGGGTSGTVTLNVGTLNQNTTGSAGSVATADESSDTTCFVTFATAASGNLPMKTGTNLLFNSSSGLVTSVDYTVTSDARHKYDVQDLNVAWDEFNKIRPVTHRWNEDKGPKGVHQGLIAQEVQEVYPEFVVELDDGTLTINYPKMIPMLINTIKNLNNRLEALENK